MSRTTVKLSARDYNNTASTASNFIGSGSISPTNLNSQAQSSSNRNLIINGDMTISQRGSSWTTASGYGDYTVDRWMTGHTVTGKFSSAWVEDAPTGFKYSWKATSASAYSVGAGEEFIVRQKIEGSNCAHLALGSASAKTVTLSFWVKSSLTGTFTGAFLNSAENRCYIFTYAISSAATWEKKEVTVALDTSGTWLTTNGIGLTLYFSLGAGANLVGTAGSWAGAKDLTVSGAVNFVGTGSATWQITGVQLEVGSTSTDFELEPFETTLAKCQRYFCRTYAYGTATGAADTSHGAVMNSIEGSQTYASAGNFNFPVEMRAAPTVTLYRTYNASTTGKVTADATDGTGSIFGIASSRCFIIRNDDNSGTGANVFMRAHAIAAAEL